MNMQANPLCEEFYQKLFSFFESVSGDLAQKKFVQTQALLDFLLEYQKILTLDSSLILHHLNASPSSHYVFLDHTVGVFLLSAYVSAHFHLTEEENHSLLLSSFLHDVGYLRLQKELFYKPGALPPSELALIHEHPVLGVELLKECSDAPPLVLEVVVSHHERMDGTGYPRELKGDKIPYLSRLISIIDAYEALTHFRPYRPRRTPHQAMKEIFSQRAKAYEPSILKEWLDIFSFYPPGSMVRLNDGSVAEVISCHKKKPLSPVIKLLKDAEGVPVTKTKLISLADVPSLRIDRDME